MAIRVEDDGKVRTVEDDLNPRCQRTEFLCHGGCGTWIEESEVIWADPETGDLTTGERGKPFCDACLPEEAAMFCHECGRKMKVFDGGVSHHLDDDGGVDHDMDANHVAYSFT